jgi:predicted Fe-Mo cluster-binding NifX family protein
MKLCVTSTGKDIEAKMDARFGRALYFLIIDTDTNALDAVLNSAAEEQQGAGISAAQLVLDRGIDGVLTGRVGPNTLNVFRASRVKLYEGASPQDTVKVGLDKFKRGEYIETPATSENASRRQVGVRGGGRGMGGGQGGGMGAGRGRGIGGGRGRGRQG